MLFIGFNRMVRFKEYYRIVGGQLSSLVANPSITDPAVLRCATHSIVALVSRQPRLGKVYIISPLISPLVTPFFTCKCDESVIDELKWDLDGDMVLVSEVDVESVLRSIGRLLVGTEPHPLVVDALQSIWVVFFFVMLFFCLYICHILLSCCSSCILITISFVNDIPSPAPHPNSYSFVSVIYCLWVLCFIGAVGVCWKFCQGIVKVVGQITGQQYRLQIAQKALFIVIYRWYAVRSSWSHWESHDCKETQWFQVEWMWFEAKNILDVWFYHNMIYAYRSLVCNPEAFVEFLIYLDQSDWTASLFLSLFEFYASSNSSDENDLQLSFES